MKNQLIGLLFIVLLSSCYTKKGALERFCHTDSVEVVIHDTLEVEIVIGPDSSQFNFDCSQYKDKYDSLLNSKSSLIDSNGYQTIFENKKTKVKARPTKSGSLEFNFIDKGDTAKASIPFEVKVSVPCKERSWSTLDHAKEIWQYFIWTIILSFVIGYIIGLRRN
jgi:hypothetical protein